jgi:hypothetical protein
LTSDSHEYKSIIVNHFLQQWVQSRSKTTSVDAETYSNYFAFIPVVHTVHDQNKTPVLILMDRFNAIELAKKYYDLKGTAECRIPT